MIINRFKAFTLSEVLITLSIIGVVAAITMPLIINNYKKVETVSRLKQTYTIISQAVNMSKNENGPLESWNIPNATWGNATYTQGKIFFDSYLKQYLRIIKDCKSRTKACWADKYSLANNGNATYFNASSNYTYGVVLNNGVVIGFWPQNTVVEVYIDLNGKKGPNIYSKDAFIIIIAKEAISSNNLGQINKAGVYMYGQGYSREKYTGQTSSNCSYCPCNKRQQGHWCGALIMFDNWQINSDYPW